MGVDLEHRGIPEDAVFLQRALADPDGYGQHFFIYPDSTPSLQRIVDDHRSEPLLREAARDLIALNAVQDDLVADALSCDLMRDFEELLFVIDEGPAMQQLAADERERLRRAVGGGDPLGTLRASQGRPYRLIPAAEVPGIARTLARLDQGAFIADAIATAADLDDAGVYKAARTDGWQPADFEAHGQLLGDHMRRLARFFDVIAGRGLAVLTCID